MMNREKKKKCALLTCKDLTGFVTDESYLEKALSSNSWDYEWMDWRREGVVWENFDCALIRTTWDYIHDCDYFLKQLKKIDDSSCELLNPYQLVQWNSNKRYLRDLEEKGISVVPTHWFEFGPQTDIQNFSQQVKSQQCVLKPQVGAGASDTYLLDFSERQYFFSDLKNLDGRNVMLQPFVKEVSLEGEYSVFFFDGEYSHGILKTPKKGDFRSQEEFGSHIKPIDMTDSQKAFCKKVLKAIVGDWLFARVDFVQSESKGELLMELELIEPSLYFRYKEKSAQLLVEKLSQRF